MGIKFIKNRSLIFWKLYPLPEFGGIIIEQQTRRYELEANLLTNWEWPKECFSKNWYNVADCFNHISVYACTMW